MLQLASKNFEDVTVSLRGDETIRMTADKGLALMNYLTQDNVGSHVMITDVDGTVVVISRHEIKKIVPRYKQNDIKLSELEI